MDKEQIQELNRLHRTYKRIQKNGYLKRKDLPRVDKITEDFFAGKTDKSLLNKIQSYREQEIKQGSQEYRKVIDKVYYPNQAQNKPL